MATINDGGPAFPHPSGWRRNPEVSDGMTLRQYYAAKAMRVFVAEALDDSGLGGADFNFETVARRCFAMADAMIAEGARENEQA
jgi:hypothetical protein